MNPKGRALSYSTGVQAHHLLRLLARPEAAHHGLRDPFVPFEASEAQVRSGDPAGNDEFERIARLKCLHVVKPGEVENCHDQVVYWLWEPATGVVIQTLAIPRGQVAAVSGSAAPDATGFELRGRRDCTDFGICSQPFLERNFTTVELTVKVSVNREGTWSYDEDTVLQIPDRERPVPPHRSPHAAQVG